RAARRPGQPPQDGARDDAPRPGGLGPRGAVYHQGFCAGSGFRRRACRSGVTNEECAMTVAVSFQVNGGNNLQVSADYTGTVITQEQITCNVRTGGGGVPPTQILHQGTIKHFLYTNLANGTYAVHVD